MGTDRNTVIGFVLLGVLLFLYLFTSTRNSQELQKQRKMMEDSIAVVKAHQEAIARLQDTTVNKQQEAIARDTTGFNGALTGKEHLLVVENDLLKIVFTNKGGQPATVELKKFNSYDSTPVKVVNAADGDRFTYPIVTGINQSAASADLFFRDGELVKQADGTQTVSFRLPAPAGESIVHRYTLRQGSYTVDWDVEVQNPSLLFSQNNLNLEWYNQVTRTQQSIIYEKQLSNVGFYEDNNFDYIRSKTERKLDKPVQWVSVASQFFNNTLIAKNNFLSGDIHWRLEPGDTSDIIGLADISLQAKLPAGSATSLALQLYYGPNDYNILKTQAAGMDKIVNLGRDMYSFVRPLNVYVIMPVFNFFKQFISSYGIAILLLTLFIRLLTSPLVYSSYLSGAKMKALRPEIEAMKKRVGGDQQQVGMEQMKLFREAGVNPLGGCIPALLQIPIFFALYSFFNSNIALRGQHFLWSKDLSIFDSVVHFGFSIPGYGDHVSLFALLAVATSFLISLYGMSMTPDQSNPAMKYMPYIMPVMLLVFFNKLPSALTWYYTVSNAITLVLQFVIQHYIIDHTKILAKLQENRSKPKAKSKWQERLELMQETQKKAQQTKGGK